MVKNQLKNFKKLFLSLKYHILLTFKVKNPKKNQSCFSWTFHMESPLFHINPNGLPGHGLSDFRFVTIAPLMIFLLGIFLNFHQLCMVIYLLYKLYSISNFLLIQSNKKVEAQPRPFYSFELVNSLKSYTTYCKT